VATRLSPEQLLESLVNPQAQLAEGFGLLVATLKDGSTVIGSITQATTDTYHLQSPDGKESTLERSLIASQLLTSPMPPAGTILSKREIRDLLAFLSTLR
jgi:putative heme-binding domain-containing protein